MKKWRSLSLFCISLLAQIGTMACAKHSGYNKTSSQHKVDNKSYPLAALRDNVRDKIRIYGQFHTATTRHPEHGPWQVIDEFCSLYGANGRHEIVKAMGNEIMIFDNQPEISISEWFFDCEGSHPWAESASVRLSSGQDLGEPISIITIGTKKTGKVAACSQPLHTNRDWLPHWVDFYLSIGVSKIFMHAPQGSLVDDLFNENRESRINMNAVLAERNPELVGKERLKRFDRPINQTETEKQVEWVDYWPSPMSMFYAEELMFTICHYRLRYEFDYVLQFDVDEFFYLNAAVNQSQFNLPSVLDAHFPENAATLSVYQKLYIKECQTRATGEYTSRFTLGAPWVGQPKPVVRPMSVRRMHVHGIISADDEWVKKYGSEWNRNLTALPYQQFYLKHIRPFYWFENGIEKNRLCSFGQGAQNEGLDSGMSIFY